jgi:phosphatidylinositol-3-phosphatase
VRRRALALTAVAVATALSVMACGSSVRQGTIQTRPSATIRLAGGPPSHIVVIVMENEEYPDVIGSAQTPFINLLAKHYALATGMYAVTHPSLPNYLALTGGSTFGIDSDCTSCSVGTTSIVDQLEQAHISWKAYMEDLPHPCFMGSEWGDYAKKHDPFMYYTRIADVSSRCIKVVPMTQLALDERANTLPTFVWITPNLCHDMHDCDLITGDQFLLKLVPPLLRALGSRGLLIITWDEGSSDDGCCRLAAGGHIVTILAGGLARAGARMQTPADHYSTLQAIEDLLHLPRLRGAACPCTPTLRPLLAGGG